MNTLTPKQQEIANRASRILEVARPMIVKDGYHGLNMDRIASELGLSKGTVYNHFSCKEEIVISLAIETMTKRTDMFRQAAQFRGCTRFRMLAIGDAAERFVRESPEHFRFEQILRLDSVWEKTSEKRRSVIQTCETNCMAVVAGITRDAIANGEIELPDHMTPEDLVFGLWSLTTGAYSIVLTSDSLDSMQRLGMSEPYETVRTHVSVLLDGYGWTPHSSKFDRNEIIANIGKEVFSDE